LWEKDNEGAEGWDEPHIKKNGIILVNLKKQLENLVEIKVNM